MAKVIVGLPNPNTRELRVISFPASIVEIPVFCFPIRRSPPSSKSVQDAFVRATLPQDF